MASEGHEFIIQSEDEKLESNPLNKKLFESLRKKHNI